mmetsp:Transcript_26923/g.65451  ORF Transcript_26923/g.65451 Transcript_26923/m.65451 type:complete len:225 (+) Transcript_26923:564-1238(+)
MSCVIRLLLSRIGGLNLHFAEKAVQGIVSLKFGVLAVKIKLSLQHFGILDNNSFPSVLGNATTLICLPRVNNCVQQLRCRSRGSYLVVAAVTEGVIGVIFAVDFGFRVTLLGNEEGNGVVEAQEGPFEQDTVQSAENLNGDASLSGEGKNLKAEDQVFDAPCILVTLLGNQTDGLPALVKDVSSFCCLGDLLLQLFAHWDIQKRVPVSGIAATWQRWGPTPGRR